MAALSTNLPTEIDSQQRNIQAAPATPSPLTSIFDFAGSVAGVADQAWKTLDRNAREGNAAKAEAAKTNAQNDAIRRISSGILPYTGATPSNIPPASAGAYTSSQPLAAKAANAQTAATQGKIDPAMAQAQSLSVFRQALAANPGHEYAVFQAFKEAGVDNMMMQQYKNSESAVESDQTAQLDTTHALEKDAVTKYGFTNFYQMDAGTQAKTLAQVGLLNAQEADLDSKTKLADLTLKNVQLTDAQRTQLQKTNSSSLFDSANNYMTSSFSNAIKMMVNLSADPTLANQPGRLEQLQSHFMSVTLPSLDLQYQTKKAQLGSLLTPEDATRLDETYKTQRQALVDVLSGPQSVVEQQGRALKTITDTYGLDYAKSAPFLMTLTKMVGPQAVGVLTSDAVIGNPVVKKMISDELNAVIKDPSKTASFTEHVQALNGTIDPATWDPQKSLSRAPAVIAHMVALSKSDVATNGTDKQAHHLLVNAIGQTAAFSTDVVPQWGFGNVLAQGKALNSSGVVRALFTTKANTEDRENAIHAWLPASTRTYMTLATMKSTDQYYDAKFDPHTMQWSAVWNGKRSGPMGEHPGAFSLAEAASPGTYANTPTKPNPSSAVLEQTATLNNMLNTLSSAGSKGWDDTLGKSVSYKEARAFYATGEIPASTQTPAVTKQKNGKTPEQNVDDSVSHMLDFVNNLPNPMSSAKAKEIGPSPLAPAIAASSEKYNVPPNIAASLFNTETSGGRNHHDSDKGASGPGQIMPATAAGYGVNNVHSLKDTENVDLALHILSDNYKRTGSWEDALAMYHSGHDLRTATARGLNDGHMKTSDYVSSTMAAASSITPEKLKAYGYVRY